MTSPDFISSILSHQSSELVEYAVGDKNIYLLDNKDLTAICKNDGTIDGCHPTDFGFASMAKAVGDVIEKNHLLLQRC